MPRIRSIKPDLWTDDKLTACSLPARLLFIGMLNFADDYGNLDRSAKQIKARVFPVDDIDCEPLIVQLLTHGLLIEYSVSDQKYLHIKGFSKHQVINRPSKPQVPIYEDSLRTHGVLTEPSLSTHDGRERKGKKDTHSMSTHGVLTELPKGNGKREIPEGWSPSDSTLAWCQREFGLVPEAVQMYRVAFTDICKARAYRYKDFDAAFRNCVSQDWPKLRTSGRLPTARLRPAI